MVVRREGGMGEGRVLVVWWEKWTRTFLAFHDQRCRTVRLYLPLMWEWDSEWVWCVLRCVYGVIWSVGVFGSVPADAHSGGKQAKI